MDLTLPKHKDQGHPFNKTLLLLWFSTCWVERLTSQAPPLPHCCVAVFTPWIDCWGGTVGIATACDIHNTWFEGNKKRTQPTALRKGKLTIESTNPMATGKKDLQRKHHFHVLCLRCLLVSKKETVSLRAYREEHLHLPEQKNKTITLHQHSNHWPAKQHQGHSAKKKKCSSELVSLEEEMCCPPDANYEAQTSKEQDLQRECHEYLHLSFWVGPIEADGFSMRLSSCLHGIPYSMQHS